MAPPPAVVREHVERVCASPSDDRTLRLRVLAELRRAVPFDAYAWVLTDPETSVGSAPLADVPAVRDLPRLIRLRYLTALNRWTTLPDAGVALLSGATDGDLTRSLIWRELLARHDVSDVASVVFRDAYGCWAFLELWRTGGRTFDEAEVLVLQALVPPVTTAVREARARTFAEPPGTGSVPSGPTVLLLSPDLEVVRQTPGTREQLRLLVPRDDDGPPIPAGAYNVAAQLLAVEAGVDRNRPLARDHLAEGRWVTVRAARMDDGAAPSQRDIAVTIQASTAAERMALFGRCFGLSERERELVAHLAAGSDTRGVAARMYVSAYTVQDHLKSVFAKTGTHGRRSLLARALGD